MINKDNPYSLKFDILSYNYTYDENRIAIKIPVGLPLFHAEPTITDDTLQHTYSLLYLICIIR